MTARTCSLALVVGALLALSATPRAQKADASLAIKTSRVSVAGTSNIHDFTAVSTAVRVVHLSLTAADGKDALASALEPGVLSQFEVAIPVTSLSSPREGLDKNMHEALRAQEHPDIVFRLSRIDAPGAADSFRAVGILRIAGVEREVTLPLVVERAAGAITIRGDVPLVMTDFGVVPPKAMMGMLRTDPKITVSFEVVLHVPQA